MQHVIPVLLLFCTSNAISYINVFDSNYCYSNDKSPYVYFGSKTAYEFVHGDSNSNFEINDCVPKQIWSFNRHGTRLPGRAGISKLRSLTKIKDAIINSISNGLCAKDFNLFKRWKWNETITESMASFLTFQGWIDMESMARRYQLRFPDLLDIPYTPRDFLFRFTRTERTNSSFRGFAKGLFGAAADFVHGVSFENDTLLESYKHCKKWREQVENNPAIKIEYNKFLLTPEYLGMIADVSKRLGFESHLDYSVIENMFDMCRYEQSWFVGNKSTWCAAFTKEHLEIMEYGEDLLYFYNTGFGTELNSKMGCLPLKNMLDVFQGVVQGNSVQPGAIFYFTHSSAVQLLLVTMRLYEDVVPLRADNMNQQHGRLWRTSLLIPFAANLDAVLYRCDNEEFVIKFFLNEQLVQFPGCFGGVCSWKYVQETLWHIGENCNLDFCDN